MNKRRAVTDKLFGYLCDTIEIPAPLTIEIVENVIQHYPLGPQRYALSYTQAWGRVTTIKEFPRAKLETRSHPKFILFFYFWYGFLLFFILAWVVFGVLLSHETVVYSPSGNPTREMLIISSSMAIFPILVSWFMTAMQHSVYLGAVEYMVDVYDDYH